MVVVYVCVADLVLFLFSLGILVIWKVTEKVKM